MLLGRKLVRKGISPNQNLVQADIKHLTCKIKYLATGRHGINRVEQTRKNRLGGRGCKHEKISLWDTPVSSHHCHGRKAPDFHDAISIV